MPHQVSHDSINQLITKPSTIDRDTSEMITWIVAHSFHGVKLSAYASWQVKQHWIIMSLDHVT